MITHQSFYNLSKLLFAFALCVSYSGCGLVDRAGAVLTANTKSTQAFANSLVVPSGMNRASGIEIVAKLYEIFPHAVLSTDPTYCATQSGWTSFSLSDTTIRAAFDYYASPEHINYDAHKTLGDNWGPYPNNCYYGPGEISRYIPSVEAIGVAERSSSALTQMSARILFDDLCDGDNLNAPKTNLFTDDPSLLMTGEQFPTDAATHIAFTVARRAWKYPYTADSAEVKVLSDIYTSTTDPALQKKYLCQTAILSDQFWVGNPFKEDILRRVTLPLVGRSPSFAEIESYKKGTLKLKDYVTSLQGESAYMKSILRWHGAQLGLRTAPSNNELFDLIGPNYHSASRLSGYYFDSALSFSGVHSFTTSNSGYSHDGCVSPEVSWWNGGTNLGTDWSTSFVEGTIGEPIPTFNAPFDPRTTGIYWEQFNPHSNKFEIMAAWVLKPFLSQYQAALGADPVALNLCHPYTSDPRWLKCNGLITLNDNSQKQITLEDITQDTIDGNSATIAHNTTDENGSTRTNNLIGTPMETIPLENVRFARAPLRRTVRYAPPTTENPTGRNTNFSAPKGIATDKPMYACNSVARFIATCAYHPPKSRTDLVPRWYWAQYTGDHTYGSEWNAAKPSPYLGDDMGHNIVSIGYTFAHPDVLSNFRCGNTNTTALAADDASFSLDAAIPYGYDPLLPYDSGQTVDAQIPASWLVGVQSMPSQASLNNIVNSTRGAFSYGNSANDSGWYGVDELSLPTALVSGLATEPYNLLTDIISNNKDYGLTTTANYTLIPKGLEFLYRAGGESVSVRPAGYTPPTGAQTINTIVKLEFSTMQPMPKRMYDIDSLGKAGNRNLQRPAAGLLSMPAILDPMGDGTPRSISQRVFKRFLCGDANLYNPAEDHATDLHLTSFGRMATSVYLPGSADYNASDTPNVQNFVDTHLSANSQLRSDCMTCHQNLDPLGMGLFKYYGSFVARKTSLSYVWNPSELRRAGGNDQNPAGTPGIVSDQDEQGDGVFLGKTIHGFAGVGAAIAGSKLYYACAAQTAFNNLFGRLPSDMEVKKYYQTAVDKFYQGRNYNQMIVDLALIQEELGGQ